MDKMQEQFTRTFDHGLWPSGGESKSGMGSTLDFTIHFRENLLRIINEYKIEKIFDCSCGDWNWMKEIKEQLPIYIGNDIVEQIVTQNNEKYSTDKISFINGDMLSQMKKYDDKYFDLILCRHTLEHLPQDYCVKVVTEMKRVTKYALITSANHSPRNKDIRIDGKKSRQINLDTTPYVEVLGEPTEVFFDSKGEEQEVGCHGHLFKWDKYNE